MNATLQIDLDASYIKIDGAVVYTAPHGWEPVAQIAGEIDDLADAGTIDRATEKVLQKALWSSELGLAQQRRKEWQQGGVRVA